MSISPLAPPAAVTIVLADDHAVVRAGLRLLLDGDERLQVVAEAGDVDDALRRVAGLRPTVLLLDLNMPGSRSALGSIPEVAALSGDTAVVVLTMQSDVEIARRALRLGARGYVLKEAAGEELVDAVLGAARGETYLSPRLGAALATATPKRTPVEHRLSAREIDVLRLIALGHTNAEIARRLYISVRTVESHRARIQRKLGRSTRAQLVRYALDHGVVDPDAG
jgi:two-component system, NarL family, response regulator NreC